MFGLILKLYINGKSIILCYYCCYNGYLCDLKAYPINQAIKKQKRMRPNNTLI